MLRMKLRLPLRALLAVPVVVPVLGAGLLVGGVGTAAASTATATVGDTGGVGLTIRTGPHTTSGSLGLVWDGQRVTISCQARGDTVTNEHNFTSNLWDYVPNLNGYLADAYMATGYDDRIPGVPDCAGGGSEGQLVPVSQFQGQPNQGEDCGPTSVVTALLADGVTPHGWGTSQVAAINAARSDMGYDPSWNDPNQFGTGEGDVQTALAANGVDSDIVNWDIDTVLAHVRNGHPVVLAGNMKDLPWSGHDVAHFLTVAGYSGGDYLVLDPASDTIVYHTTAAVLTAFWDNDLGHAGVMLW
jgi:hypothetical protein